MSKIKELFDSLKMTNQDVLIIAETLYEKLNEPKVSAKDNQICYIVKKNKTQHLLFIDDIGDIEYIKKTGNDIDYKVFYFEDGINIDDIIKKIN